MWVHRKGATTSRADEAGIIPGSMGTASYIVQGLGNPQPFMSCSHGAGRVMGRKAASRSLAPEACDQVSSAISNSWLIVMASTTLWAAGHSVM